MFGLPESGLADTLRDAEEGIGGFEALEITTCLRRGEIEIATVFEPPFSGVYDQFEAAIRERHGAVSAEVAAALADGALGRFGATLGIGITGVAGPGGGSAAKPVGMVCISVAHVGGQRLDRTVQLPGSREMVRERTTTVAMHMLRRLLSSLEP